MKDNPYKILGVEDDATEEDIKAAFRKLSMTLHPDRGGGADEMQALKEAYDLLRDQRRRKFFDETGYMGRGTKAAVERDNKIYSFINWSLAQVLFPSPDERGQLAPAFDIERADLTKACQVALRGHLRKEIDPHIATMTGNLRKMNAVRRRLRAPAGSPVLEAMRGGRLTLVRTLRIVTTDRRLILAAIKALDDATYEFSTPPSEFEVGPVQFTGDWKQFGGGPD